MARKYAKGDRAWGICGRGGHKMLLKDMVFDGYIPNMRVDPAWYEGKHPQEYLPKVDDPVALFRPSPEVIFAPSAPVLIAVQTGSFSVTLTWTPAENDITEMQSYTILRSHNGGEFEELAFCPIIRDFQGSIIGIENCTTATVPTVATKQFFRDAPVSYVDDGLTQTDTYCYSVFATPLGNRISQAEGPNSPMSNTECLTVTALVATAPVLSIEVVLQVADLTWTASTITGGTIIQYELWRQVDNAGPFTHFADTDGVTLHYEDSPTVGHEYHYFVVAVPDVGGNSPDSNIVDAIISNDPFFDLVVLLLHLDGTNGQTTTIDSSNVHNVMSIVSAGALTTTTPKFGTASFKRIGTGTSNHDSVTAVIAQAAPLDILSGSEDFTIEGWVYLPSGAGTVHILDYGGDQVSFNDDSGIRLEMTIGNPGSVACIAAGITDGSAQQWGNLAFSNPVVVADTWYHWAITRTGGIPSLYWNGNRSGNLSNFFWLLYPFPAHVSLVGIGHTGGVLGTEGPCQVDEVRVTKGLARYTGATYVIPTAASFP